MGYRYKGQIVTTAAIAIISSTILAGCTEDPEVRTTRIANEFEVTSNEITAKLKQMDPNIEAAQIVINEGRRELEVGVRKPDGTIDVINYGPIEAIEEKLKDDKYLESLSSPDMSAIVGGATGMLAGALLAHVLMQNRAAPPTAGFRPNVTIPRRHEEEERKRRGGGFVNPYVAGTHASSASYNSSRIKNHMSMRSSIRSSGMSSISGMKSVTATPRATISARGSFSSGGSGGRGGGAGGAGG